MSAAGETKPSRGPKGAAPRDSHEADARSLALRQWSKEAER